MLTGTFDYEGKTYAINIKRVFELIESPESKTRTETEITDGYELADVLDKKGNVKTQQLSPVSKIVREIKTPADTQMDNIKYDFIKMLIGQVISTEDSVDYGTSICMNTLINEKILIEVE